MSYEGFEEFICERGHYMEADAYETEPQVCEICGSKMEWQHSVDMTNGMDPNNPYTWYGEKQVVALEFRQKKDRFGNKYYDELPVYQPVGSYWRKVTGTRQYSIE